MAEKIPFTRLFLKFEKNWMGEKYHLHDVFGWLKNYYLHDFFRMLCIPVVLNIPTHVMVWHDHNFSHNVSHTD
jgi:hypothetical protein